MPVCAYLPHCRFWCCRGLIVSESALTAVSHMNSPQDSNTEPSSAAQRRLDLLSPELTKMLAGMTPERQREFAVAACRYALHRANVRTPLILDTFVLLADEAAIPAELLFEVESLMNSFEDKYERLQEADPNSYCEFMNYFHKARAVAALMRAVGSEGFEQTSECIYEASQTSDDERELVDALLPLAVTDYLLEI